MSLDTRATALVAKLHHDLPIVRERAISSLFSKVIVSGLISLASFPASELASALVRALSNTTGVNESSTQQLLRLITELARFSPTGAAALCRCGALRRLEAIAVLGDDSDADGRVEVSPQQVSEILLSLAPGVAAADTRGEYRKEGQHLTPSTGTRLSLREEGANQSGMMSPRLSSRILGTARTSLSLPVATPDSSQSRPDNQSRRLVSSASPASPFSFAPRSQETSALSNGDNATTREAERTPISTSTVEATLEAAINPVAKADGPRLEQTKLMDPLPRPQNPAPSLSPPNTTELSSDFGANTGVGREAPEDLFAQYHSGWRPAKVGLDTADLRRLSDIEAALCQRGRGDHEKASACHALAAFLDDCPVEVLLERPAAIHALLALAKAPAAEAATRATAAASGGDSNESGHPLLFQRLLDASLCALAAIATALGETARRHASASVMGGAATAAAARTSRAVERAEQVAHEEEEKREWGNSDNTGSSGSMHGALWSPVLQRYPCPLVQHARSSGGDTATAATPLSIGGAALLVFRTSLPMAFPTCASMGARSGRKDSDEGGVCVVANCETAERVLSICHSLLPLLKEPRSTTDVTSEKARGHGDPSSPLLCSRQMTVVRVQAALELILAPLVSPWECVDNFSLAALEAGRLGPGDAGPAPLVLLLLHLVTSAVPLDWVSHLTSAAGNRGHNHPRDQEEKWWYVHFDGVRGACDVVEELACSANTLRRAGVSAFACSVVDALALRLDPHKHSKGISSARQLLTTATPLARRISATASTSSPPHPLTPFPLAEGVGGGTGPWAEGWIESLAAAVDVVLPHANPCERDQRRIEATHKEEQQQRQPSFAVSLCRGSVFMWALCVVPTALLSTTARGTGEQRILQLGQSTAEEVFESALSSQRGAAENLMLSFLSAATSDEKPEKNVNDFPSSGNSHTRDATSVDVVSNALMDVLADFLAPSPPSYVHDDFPFRTSEAGGSLLSATFPTLAAVGEVSTLCHLHVRSSGEEWEAVTHALVFSGLLGLGSTKQFGASGSGSAGGSLGGAVLARIGSVLSRSGGEEGAKSARRLLGTLAQHLSLPHGCRESNSRCSSNILLHLCLRLGQRVEQRREEDGGGGRKELEELSATCGDALAAFSSPATQTQPRGGGRDQEALFELRRCFDVDPSERIAGAEWLAFSPTSPLQAGCVDSSGGLVARISLLFNERLDRAQDFVGILRSYTHNATTSSSGGDSAISAQQTSGGLASTFSLGSGGCGRRGEGRAALSFGSSDVSQLVSLALDSEVGVSTRAAAMHQLAQVLGRAFLSQTNSGSPRGVEKELHGGSETREQASAARVGLGGPAAVGALLDAALTAASPFAATATTAPSSFSSASPEPPSMSLVDDASEAGEAALNLVLVLLWSLPGLVRPRILASLGGPTGLPHEGSEDEDGGSSRESNATDGDGRVLVAWLFASASPSFVLRRAANAAALILWRTLFDPEECGTSASKSNSGSTDGHRGKYSGDVAQAAAVVSPRARYPPSLLLQFPPPPLAPLHRALGRGESVRCQGVEAVSLDSPPPTTLLGVLETVDNSSLLLRRPVVPLSSLPSFRSIAKASPRAGAFFVGELRRALNPPASGVHGSDPVAAWIGGRASASALLQTMAQSKSHAELTRALVAANTWVGATPECEPPEVCSRWFVRTFVGVDAAFALPADPLAGNSNGVQSHAPGDSLLPNTTFCGGKSPTAPVTRPVTWEGALAPLLRSTPTAPRDMRLLLKAMPLLKAVARALSPSALSRFAKTVAEVMGPVLLLDTSATEGAKRTRSQTGDHAPVFFPASDDATDISLGTSASERASASPIWLPSSSPPGSINSSTRESNEDGWSRSGARTAARLQNEVLVLLSVVLGADSSHFRSGVHHGGNVSLDFAQSPSLFVALIGILRRRKPASFLLTTASVGVLSGRGNSGEQSASVGAEVQCGALALVAALARATARKASSTVTASLGTSNERAAVAGLATATSHWGRYLGDLVGASEALLSIPRLPDTFVHKEVVRRALDSTRSLLHLTSTLKNASDALTSTHSDTGPGGNGLLSGNGLGANLPGQTGPRVLQWVRRLSVDREATVRAGALGLLGEAFKLRLCSHTEEAQERVQGGDSETGSTSHIVGAWTMAEALRACVRAASDPSEAPVARSEALNAITDALEHQFRRDRHNTASSSSLPVPSSSPPTNESTLLELQRTVLACVSALGAAREDGSALAPCFIAAAARLVNAVATGTAASTQPSPYGATFGPVVSSVVRSGLAASLAEAWSDPTVLAKLHHTALAHATSLVLPLPRLDRGDGDDCREMIGFNAGLGGGTLLRDAYDGTVLAATLVLRALRATMAAADGASQVLPASSSPFIASTRVRHSLLHSTHFLNTLLRLVCSPGTDGNQNGEVGAASNSIFYETRGGHALWVEAALTLVDVLEGEGSATAGLLNDPSSNIPGTLALSIAATLDQSRPPQECRFGVAVYDKGSGGNSSSCDQHRFTLRVALSAKLAVSMLRAQGWGSCLAARHPHASAALWRALANARRRCCPLNLHSVASTSVAASAAHLGLVAWSLSLAELSLHLHSALSLLADLRADLSFAATSAAPENEDRLECEETVDGDAPVSAQESLVDEILSEVNAVHHYYIQGFPSSLSSGAVEVATALLAFLCQPRLTCLRSLAALCDDAVGAKHVSSLGVFADQVWGSVAALSRGLEAATPKFKPSRALSPCMDLLVGAVANAAVSGSDTARRALCVPPSWIDDTKPTLSASSASSKSSASSSTAHHHHHHHHASPQQSVIARRLIKLAMSSASSAAGGTEASSALRSPVTAVAGAIVAVTVLCSVSEGRALLLQHSAVARFVQILRHSLVDGGRSGRDSSMHVGGNTPSSHSKNSGESKAAAAFGTRGGRAAAAERVVSLLRLLVSVSVHAEVATALLQAPGFGDWLQGQVECFARQDEKDAKTLIAADQNQHHKASSSAHSTQVPAASSNLSRVQPKERSACRAARREPLLDPLASPQIRELVALLVRNLAMHRGHKSTLIAITGVLSFLLFSVDTAATRNAPVLFREIDGDSSGTGDHGLKVCAAASAALWSLCHHCERAVGALRTLHANAPVSHCLERLSLGGEEGAAVFAKFPSVVRAKRHLSMLQLLLAR